MRLIRLSDQSEFLRTITEQAAVQADDDGRASDAVLLYHLAEDYDTVVQILNKNLSAHIALDDGGSGGYLGYKQTKNPAEAAPEGSSSVSLASVDDPTQLALNMMTMYQNNPNVLRKILHRNREACGVLLTVAEAKKRYEEGDWAACLEVCSS